MNVRNMGIVICECRIGRSEYFTTQATLGSIYKWYLSIPKQTQNHRTLHSKLVTEGGKQERARNEREREPKATKPNKQSCVQHASRSVAQQIHLGAQAQLIHVALRSAAHAADSLCSHGRRHWAFMQSVPPLGTMFHLRPWSPTSFRGSEQPRET